MTKAKQIEQIAELIYDCTQAKEDVCMLCAERIFDKDWRE